MSISIKEAEQISMLLKGISFLSNETWNCLVENAVSVELEKHDFFVKEHEISREIGILTDGIVRSYYTTENGKEYNKTIFTAPSIIGSYVSFITGQPSRLPQQALTKCKITKIPLRVFKELSKNNIEIERLRRKIAENFFVIKEKRELEMALLNAEERYSIFQKEFPEVENQIPQYHIASYLGVSPTQLSRIRHSLK